MEEHKAIKGNGDDKVTQITSSMVQLTVQQYKELCDSVKYIPTGKKSFIGCSLRFNGDEDREGTMIFIESLQIYKKISNISDEDAILTFPLLLMGDARNWWQGVSAGIKTWSAVIKSLQYAFAPQMQPHEIYMKIFSTPQDQYEPLKTFLDRKRVLLAQFPPELYNEDQQIDLIYGLLNLKLREKIMRSDIKSFHWLMERAAYIESIDVEKDENN